MEVEQRFLWQQFSLLQAEWLCSASGSTALAELLSNKKGADYATTFSWLLAKVCFAILPLTLLCLRGSRIKRQTVKV